MANRTASFTFIIGLGLGAAAAVLGPRVVGPYLPGVASGDNEVLEGIVRDKQREGERLLVTLVTREGTVLATFTREVSNIDILVQRGDSLALTVPKFEPFVDNPTIERVVQPAGRPALRADSAPTGPSAPPAAAQPPADTAAAAGEHVTPLPSRDST